MYGPEVATRFFSIKAGTLLHDPPTKMFFIKKHEELAKQVFETILRNIDVFREPLTKELRDVVVKADIMASTFDRWFFKPLNKADYYINYHYLHNIHDPRYKYEIPTPSGEKSKDLLEYQEKVSRKLNELLGKLLNAINECEYVSKNKDLWYKTWLLYTLLYILYETIWYQGGKVVSLADTRAPTHTVFDHVYASTSIANLLYKYAAEKKLIPSGYLVRIDVPSIQKFISSSRKVGDLWAASWILSNVTWKMLWKLISYYGPDILIKPSPRLNPYLVNSVLKELDELCKKCSEHSNDIEKVREELMRIYVDALNRITPLVVLIGMKRATHELEPYEKTLEFMKYVSLIPATAIFVLPKISYKGVEIDEPQKVVNLIKKHYEESWKEFIEELHKEIKNKLKDAENKQESLIIKLADKLFSKIKDLVKTPHTGLKIEVVDLENTYNKIIKCLSGGESCEELGVDNEELGKLIKEGIDVNEIALRILWHIGITRVLNNPDIRTTPILRQFWLEEKGRLVSIGDYVKETEWIPCTLCGLEPAIIKLGKIEREGKIEYSEEDINNLVKQITGEEELPIDKLKSILKIYFKPGEALGPYCLLKRITYIAYQEKFKELVKPHKLKTGVSSTDDVALVNYDYLLKELRGKLNIDLVADYARYKNISPHQAKEVLKWIFPETLNESIPNRDVSIAAERSGVRSYDEFIRDMRDFLRGELSKIFSNVNVSVSVKEVVERMFKPKHFLDLDEFLKYEIKVEELARELSPLRTYYAIVRGDADDVGKILSGELFGLDTNKYLRSIYNSIKEYAEIEGNELHALRELEKSLELSIRLARAVNKDNAKLIVSPAYITHLSLSLMITALKDVLTTQIYRGLIVFAGGDDTLALFSLETVYQAVSEMRLNYSDKKPFILLNGSPIVSTPVTGKSISVRIANLKDLLSSEISMATQYLDNIAKETKWIFKDNIEWRKDTLVVSDSRGKTYCVLPLRTIKDQLFVTDTSHISLLFKLWLRMLFGWISKNIPEDLYKYVTGNHGKQLIVKQPNILGKFVELIISRNIKIRDSQSRGNLLKEIIDEFNKNDVLNIKFTIRDSSEYNPVLISLIESNRIMRRYP